MVLSLEPTHVGAVLCGGVLEHQLADASGMVATVFSGRPRLYGKSDVEFSGLFLCGHRYRLHRSRGVDSLVHTPESLSAWGAPRGVRPMRLPGSLNGGGDVSAQGRLVAAPPCHHWSRDARAVSHLPRIHAGCLRRASRQSHRLDRLGGVAFFFTRSYTLFGRLVDRTKSFDLGLALAGLLPLAACAAIWLFWGKEAAPSTGSEQATDSPSKPAHSG
jgi:hypothetical protein